MSFLKLHTFEPRDGNDFSDTDDDATPWIVLESAKAMHAAPGEAADTHPRRHEGDEHMAMPFRTTGATYSSDSASSSSSHMAYFRRGSDDAGTPHENSSRPTVGSQAGDDNDCERCQEGGQLCAEHNQAHHEALHAEGRCQPCAYANRKANGCRKGFLCSYCHFCDNSDYQAWTRRVRKINRRSQQHGPHHG
eukprot:TRINITY_DN17799_c0_g1_i9.p1 TRINITY_DN17799_c0_g1~~TRINITY_DN17799_c0_g1_i9.p1  ORF type:complete len:192 (-),score=27.09 TRINITY_DN17799_c0_g1_i9:498-1073(-)